MGLVYSCYHWKNYAKNTGVCIGFNKEHFEVEHLLDDNLDNLDFVRTVPIGVNTLYDEIEQKELVQHFIDKYQKDYTEKKILMVLVDCFLI